MLSSHSCLVHVLPRASHSSQAGGVVPPVAGLVPIVANLAADIEVDH
jgi:hypothetical protein